MRRELVLLGGGGHARSIFALLNDLSDFQTVGYIAPEPMPETPGLAYLGTDRWLKSREAKTCAFVAAVGEATHRARAVRAVLEARPDAEFPSLVHPTSWKATSACCHPGTLLFPGSRLGAFATLHPFSYLHANSVLEHDSILGAYASLSPGALVAGDVRIGAYASVGLGAVVRQGVRIGPHARIGAGAVVLEDVPEKAIAVGNPARVSLEKSP